MKKILAVVRREFVERVRTKAFVISTVLLPVFMVAMVLLPVLMMSGGDRTSRVALVDASTTNLGQRVSQALESEKIGKGADAKSRYTVQVFPATGDELARVRDGLIAETGFSSSKKKNGWNGVMVLTDETLATGKLAYYGGKNGKDYNGKIDNFDYAGIGTRPPGSSFKPYTLATVLTQTLNKTKDLGVISLGVTNKMFWSEMHRDAMELALDIFGASSMLVSTGPEAGNWPAVMRAKGRDGYKPSPMMSAFFFSRSETIWGGTAEIQRNIVGEKVLGLPREPKAEGAKK